MSSQALDVTTIMHALRTLEAEDIVGWKAVNESQLHLFKWMEQHGCELDRINGLDALASTDYQALNAFLAKRKFQIQFSPFPPRDIGVVSVLDKQVRWQDNRGKNYPIHTEMGIVPGFRLSVGANVYKLDDFVDAHLVELKTTSEDTLWLAVGLEPGLSGIRMVRHALALMNTAPRGNVTLSYDFVAVPKVDLDVQPDISWMAGAISLKPAGYAISQALQQLKLRMNETGARVKAATAMSVMRGMVRQRHEQAFVINKPFYGWWVQEGVSFPMGVFFADWDSLKQPEGTLEDL